MVYTRLYYIATGDLRAGKTTITVTSFQFTIYNGPVHARLHFFFPPYTSFILIILLRHINTPIRYLEKYTEHVQKFIHSLINSLSQISISIFRLGLFHLSLYRGRVRVENYHQRKGIFLWVRFFGESLDPPCHSDNVTHRVIPVLLSAAAFACVPIHSKHLFCSVAREKNI